MIDEAIDKDIDFNKIITEVEKGLEDHYTETRDDFTIKTLKEHNTSDASTYIKKSAIDSNSTRMDYIDYFVLYKTSEKAYCIDAVTLKKLHNTARTAVADFQLTNFDEKEESISSLKKQIKNCKNPMKLKELNQKLNAAYKKRKRKK